MRGYSHATSGAAGWLALTSASTVALDWASVAPPVALAGAVLAAGAALAPDCDHPSGTIAWSLPTVQVFGVPLIPSPTRLLCKGVSAVSGGHRHGTHSIIGIAAFTGLTWAAARVTVPIASHTISLATIIAVLLAAFALKAFGVSKDLGRDLTRGTRGGRGLLDSLIEAVGALVGFVLRTWLGSWLLAVGGIAVLTVHYEWQWTWLWLPMLIGCTLHVIGDSLTTGGVPWLWPLNPKPPRWLRKVPLLRRVWRSNGYFGFPILGDTDEEATIWSREGLMTLALGAYALYLTAWQTLALVGKARLLY